MTRLDEFKKKKNDFPNPFPTGKFFTNQTTQARVPFCHKPHLKVRFMVFSFIDSVILWTIFKVISSEVAKQTLLGPQTYGIAASVAIPGSCVCLNWELTPPRSQRPICSWRGVVDLSEANQRLKLIPEACPTLNSYANM